MGIIISGIKTDAPLHFAVATASGDCKVTLLEIAGNVREEVRPCKGVTSGAMYIKMPRIMKTQVHHTSYMIHHTSCITHHTSHMTRHTSHITHHTSHITRHTLYIIHRASCITHHTPHITHHTSHVMRKYEDACQYIESIHVHAYIIFHIRYCTHTNTQEKI